MSLIEAALAALAGLAILFTLVWLVQLRTRNAGLIDAVWAWTLGLLAVWYACRGPAPAQMRLLLAGTGARRQRGRARCHGWRRPRFHRRQKRQGRRLLDL